MTNITTAAELREKIQSKRYSTFTFPVLEITIQYRKPDLLKLSLNKSLPGAIADAVITSYKEALNGVDRQEYEKRLKSQKREADLELVKDMATKGYTLLSELTTSHKILDVPESDPENNLIAWADIPEEDAIAFILNLMEKAQFSKTKQGGEISTEEVVEFPDGKQVGKRTTAGKGR